jgi:hypothetical protein
MAQSPLESGATPFTREQARASVLLALSLSVHERSQVADGAVASKHWDGVALPLDECDRGQAVGGHA